MGNAIELKIALDDISPQIWRRFVVDDSITFEMFHSVIQQVMGWDDYHKFEFKIDSEIITCCEDEYNPAEGVFRNIIDLPEFKKLMDDSEKRGQKDIDLKKLNKLAADANSKVKQGKFNLDTKIGDVLHEEGMSFSYIYDFGDDWTHTLTVEKILPLEGYAEPKCLDGERACPPEDCGSVQGYYELMKIRADKNHPEYSSRIIDRLGEDYDPEEFSIDEVNNYLKNIFNENEDDDYDKEKYAEVMCFLCGSKTKCANNVLNIYKKYSCYNCFSSGRLDKMDIREIHVDVPADELINATPIILANRVAIETFPDIWSHNKNDLRELSKKDLAFIAYKHGFEDGARIVMEKFNNDSYLENDDDCDVNN